MCILNCIYVDRPYEVLLYVWEEAQESSLDSETIARIVRVETQIAKFDFLFRSVSLSALILTHSDNLSKTLQHKSMSAAEGQHIAQLTLSVLKSLHDQKHFSIFQRAFLDHSVLLFQLHL